MPNTTDTDTVTATLDMLQSLLADALRSLRMARKLAPFGGQDAKRQLARAEGEARIAHLALCRAAALAGCDDDAVVARLQTAGYFFASDV